MSPLQCEQQCHYAPIMFHVLGGPGLYLCYLCVPSAWHTVGVDMYLLAAYLNGLLHQATQLCKPCWLLSVTKGKQDGWYSVPSQESAPVGEVTLVLGSVGLDTGT